MLRSFQQLNSEWYRQKILARKWKENSQIFNEDFYLPLYLPLWLIESASLNYQKPRPWPGLFNDKVQASKILCRGLQYCAKMLQILTDNLSSNIKSTFNPRLQSNSQEATVPNNRNRFFNSLNPKKCIRTFFIWWPMPLFLIFISQIGIETSTFIYSTSAWWLLGGVDVKWLWGLLV